MRLFLYSAPLVPIPPCRTSVQTAYLMKQVVKRTIQQTRRRQPAFVKRNNLMCRYVHILQRDIAGSVDPTGHLVVEYKYDVWKKTPNHR